MRNIVLIGMPGAGKSTAGVILAKTLCMDFLDTDILIQEKHGILLQRIIDRSGIERFLEIEADCILSTDRSMCVIASGGSAVYSDAAMKHLKKRGIAVYLETDIFEIEKRIHNIGSRGIVLAKGRTLSDIYFERLPLYEKYADITINCSGLDIEETVKRIIEALPI